MGLRTAINRALPASEEDPQLSEDTARVVFRGPYFFSEQILGVDSAQSPRLLWGALISRKQSGSQVKRHLVDDFKTPQEYGCVMEEISQPAALARANRVEDIARKIKGMVGPVVGAISLATITYMDEKPALPHDQAKTPSCKSVKLEKGMGLIPLDQAQAESLRAQMGQDAPICRDRQGYSFYGHVLVTPPAPGFEPMPPEPFGSGQPQAS